MQVHTKGIKIETKYQQMDFQTMYCIFRYHMHPYCILINIIHVFCAYVMNISFKLLIDKFN